MATVEQLLPGDEVTLGSMSGVFITRSYHPIHGAGLALVIWRLADRWSLDALDFRQEVGDVVPSTAKQRWDRIQAAFREPPKPDAPAAPVIGQAREDARRMWRDAFGTDP